MIDTWLFSGNLFEKISLLPANFFDSFFSVRLVIIIGTMNMLGINHGRPGCLTLAPCVDELFIRKSRLWNCREIRFPTNDQRNDQSGVQPILLFLFVDAEPATTLRPLL